MGDSVDLGTWAEWTAALVGLLAVIAAVVAGYYARAAFTLERQREYRAEDSRRRNQASRISAWPCQRIDKSIGIMLTNSSDSLIYDVTVTVNKEEISLRFLPPGNYFASFRKWEFPDQVTDLGKYCPTMSTDKYPVDLKYVDAKGVSWRRPPRGILTELPTGATS